MDCSSGEGEPINSFALVSYIPDPLGPFLDQLRSDLVPGCTAQSHVTLLPPRPLCRPMEEAWAQLRFQLCEMSAFELELGDIEVFPITNVIYISIRKGFEQLQGMHQQLNCGCVSFSEPFHYHPHITLAQEVPGCEVPAVLDIARRRWRECRYSRAFDLDCLTFVQNSIVPETGASRWLDLASVELQPRPVKVG